MLSKPYRDDIHARMKQADLASAVGAGVLGGGIGVILAQYLGPYTGPLIAAGLVLHIWGMMEHHRLDADAPRVWWAETLYWLCWVILLVIVWLVFTRL
jgi:hypothetical protein